MKEELDILQEETPANEVVAVFMDNDNTGGVSCFFKYNGEYYYADKSFIQYTSYGWETMIFPFDFEKQDVPDWEELYADRTGKSLEDCVEEFAGCKITKKEYINSTKRRNYDTDELPPRYRTR